MKDIINFINESRLPKKNIIDVNQLKENHKELVSNYANNILNTFNENNIKLKKIECTYDEHKFIEIWFNFLSQKDHDKYWKFRDNNKYEFPIANNDSTFDDGHNVSIILGEKNGELIHVTLPD